jgi:hypothetical protein
MNDTAMVKVVAIGGLVAIQIVNLLTAKIDSVVAGTICAIIGGIAGYELKGLAKAEAKESEQHG